MKTLPAIGLLIAGSAAIAGLLESLPLDGPTATPFSWPDVLRAGAWFWQRLLDWMGPLLGA